MKQTDQDLAFAKEFARQLRPKYENARKLAPEIPKVKFDEAFAMSLGVDRAALWKYLNSTKPPTPAIRTIVLAFKNYQISVHYGDVNTRDLVTKRTPRRRSISALQMDLPFFIRASGPHSVGMKLEPQRVGRVWKLRITAV